MNDEQFLKQAIELSKESVAIGGYPVGALIVKGDKVISTGFSDGKQLCDPTSHAETSAIRVAGQVLQKRNLDDVVLYTSHEPCVMCFMSSFWGYIPKVVFACSHAKSPTMYNEGDHDTFELNKKNRRHIELIHFTELEDEALKVITDWEEGKNK